MNKNTTKNIDQDYIELILDLSYNEKFLEEILKYRQRLGIPRTGFKSEEAESKFLKDNKIDPELSQEEVKSRYSVDIEKMNQMLAWSDLYALNKDIAILNDFKIPLRAKQYISLFITYDKRPVFFEVASFIEGGYGCAVNFCFFNGFPFKKKDLAYDKDLSALLLIYPEATKEDIKKAIDLNWPEIRICQMEILKKMGFPLRSTRSKVFRSKNELILSLHREGLKANEIAESLHMDKEGSWEYIRKIISRMKNASTVKPLTHDNLLKEIHKAFKNRQPQYTLVKKPE